MTPRSSVMGLVSWRAIRSFSLFLCGVIRRKMRTMLTAVMMKLNWWPSCRRSRKKEQQKYLARYIRYLVLWYLATALTWLPVRIQLKLAVLMYKCLHGTAPSYLADELQCSADSEARRRLCFNSWSSLTVRRTRLSTVSDRSFPVAAARTWNSLPQHVTSAPSMSVFRGRLKAFLFRRSFPWLVTATFVVPAQWLSSFLDTLIVLFTYLLTYLAYLDL